MSLPLPMWIQITIAAAVTIAAILQELHNKTQRKGQS